MDGITMDAINQWRKERDKMINTLAPDKLVEFIGNWGCFYDEDIVKHMPKDWNARKKIVCLMAVETMSEDVTPRTKRKARNWLKSQERTVK